MTKKSKLTGKLILKVYRKQKQYINWNYNQLLTARNGPSRSSKVVDFSTNGKRVCDFLLVILSCPVSEILQVSWEERPRPYSTRFPWTIVRREHVKIDCVAVAPRSEDPKLIIRVINFELTQHIRPRCIDVDVTDGRTEGRTDDLR